MNNKGSAISKNNKRGDFTILKSPLFILENRIGSSCTSLFLTLVDYYLSCAYRRSLEINFVKREGSNSSNM